MVAVCGVFSVTCTVHLVSCLMPPGVWGGWGGGWVDVGVGVGVWVGGCTGNMEYFHLCY